MKRTDLKAGEIYAVKRAGHPCLLLSTDVYEQRMNRMGPDAYRPASNLKPHRGSFATAASYGFVLLTGDADALAKADGPAILKHIEAHGYTLHAVPEGTWLNFATSAAEILATYADYQAAERRRQDAFNERQAKDDARRAAAVYRHNAVAARLNAVLGDDVIQAHRVSGHVEPTNLVLTLAQAEEIADLLDGGAR